MSNYPNFSLTAPPALAYEEWIVEHGLKTITQEAFNDTVSTAPLRWKQYILGTTLVEVNRVFHSSQIPLKWAIADESGMYGLQIWDINYQGTTAGLITIISDEDLEDKDTLNIFWKTMLDAYTNLQQINPIDELWVLQVFADGDSAFSLLQNMEGANFTMDLAKLSETQGVDDYQIVQIDAEQFIKEMKNLAICCYNGHIYGTEFEEPDPKGYKLTSALVTWKEKYTTKAHAIDVATAIYESILEDTNGKATKEDLIANPIFVVGLSEKTKKIWSTAQLE